MKSIPLNLTDLFIPNPSSKEEYLDLYIHLGYALIPLHPKTKKPIPEWLPYKEHPPSPDQIRIWHKDYPEANWAIITGKVSDLTVIDQDGPIPEEIAPFFESVPCVKTFRGYHWWFKTLKPPMKYVKKDTLELKSDASLITVPPSIHEQGVPYEWITPIHRLFNPLPEFPKALLDYFYPKTRFLPSPKSEPIQIKEGRRHRTLLSIAGRMDWTRLTEQEIVEYLRFKNQTLCIPPLPESEVDQLSAYVIKKRRDGLTPQELLPIPIKFDELIQDYAPITWKIENFIPRESITLITAPPGAYKTWLGLAIGASIAQGIPFCNRPVQQGRVLFLDRENPKILLAQRAKRVFPPSPDLNGQVGFTGLFTEPEPPILQFKRALDPKGAWVLLDPLPIYQEFTATYDTLIFDSLRAFHAHEENSSLEMTKTMNFFKSLRNIGKTILILHHRDKYNLSSYRGSSEILASVDLAFLLEPPQNGVFTLKPFKNRFSLEKTLHFQIQESETRFCLVAPE